jgi:hypothetical protein
MRNEVLNHNSKRILQKASCHQTLWKWCIYDPLSDLWLLSLVAYEKWLLSLHKIDLFNFFNSLNMSQYFRNWPIRNNSCLWWPSFGSFGQTVSEEKNLIFSIVFYFLLIFFTNFQAWEAATACLMAVGVIIHGLKENYIWSNHMEGMHMWSSFKILIEDLWLSSNVAVTVTKNRKLLSKNIF